MSMIMIEILHPDYRLFREFRFTFTVLSAVKSMLSAYFSKCLNKKLWGRE